SIAVSSSVFRLRMADASRKNRRRKNDENDVIVIDDDEPMEQLPKRGKNESPEVLELRERLRGTEEKLNKSEEKFQRLCRVAREYELRAEKAESQLDSKRGVLDAMKNQELEKKVSSLENQLEDERKAASKKRSDLSNQLALEQGKTLKGVERENILSLELEKERRQVEEYRMRMTEQSNQLVEER
ncbi:hypothetical protein PMAYCL1PPCAC_25583, partial [Pristionchus mayeri]